ncbi:MAG: hypothetical protein K8R58_00140 [Bacteroidales bacterium]|nr:hypothetical protein [Bacteroidales bacterium]
MDKKNIYIPNFFYDLIVFVSPSVLFLAGLSLGISGITKKVFLEYASNLGAVDIIAYTALILLLSYEYGRMSEALSSLFVAFPIGFFKKKNIFFKSEDLFLDMTSQVDLLNLPYSQSASKKKTRWQIYFYALRFCPEIGSDLLKRYAWEKLSRSSAFTYLILFFTSFIILIIQLFTEKSIVFGTFGFGSIIYTLISLILMLLTYYEFYKRNCWNNDLLVKILPVILMNLEKQEKDKTVENRVDCPTSKN